jgi:hypothetical protein
MSAVTDRKRPTTTKSQTPKQESRIDSPIDEAVRRRIENCSYRFVFDQVRWQYDEGTLTLSGCVPSFYLKQTLQELLRNIEQIDCIANDVDVVSSNGLSSEGSRKPR